jgi:hypothetical protein
VVLDDGVKSAIAYDLSGRAAWRCNRTMGREGAMAVQLPSQLQGVYYVKFAK